MKASMGGFNFYLTSISGSSRKSTCKLLQREVDTHDALGWYLLLEHISILYF